MDRWLGDTKWDVIHFNWGLWDMYGWRYGQHDQSPIAYEKNLDSLVLRLKKTGAKLIWATTTPACPAAEKKSNVMIDSATEQEYLSAATRVMTKHGVQLNDLHSLMVPKKNEYALGDNDVHFTTDGYKALAKQVADAIQSTIRGEPRSESEK